MSSRHVESLKIGLFGIGLDTYWPQFERLKDRLMGYIGEIDRKLTGDAVRPMLYYMSGGTCWRPEVKNLTIMVNSIYNGWRMEDVWLDR